MRIDARASGCPAPSRAPGIALRVRAMGGSAFLVAWAIGYFGTATRAVARFDPTLPMESALPLLGPAIWIYLAGIGWIAMPWFIVDTPRVFSRFATGAFVALLAAVACFALWPSGAPLLRAQASPAELGHATALALNLLHRLDAPANQLPSLHVALAWLATFAVSRQVPRRRPLAWAAGLLVTASVLFAKQHALADVAAGLALAWLSDRVGARLMR